MQAKRILNECCISFFPVKGKKQLLVSYRMGIVPVIFIKNKHHSDMQACEQMTAIF